MKHAQTIAMARDLLADGRASDVVRMIDPLLEPVDAPAASTGQLLLRMLRARVAVAHRDDPDRALDLLPSLSAVADLCTCVRAEVALWRGWALAYRHAEAGDATAALRLLDDAQGLFESIRDPSGRGWALLGQGLAYASIDEYGLLRRSLEDAEPLVDQLGDTQARRWVHELKIHSCRAAGDDARTERHIRALRSIGEDREDARLRGRAAAYDARSQGDQGRSPASVLDAANAADAFFRRTDGAPTDVRLASVQARVGVAFRRGNLDSAIDAVDQFAGAVPDDPSARAAVRVLRARVALHRDDVSEAECELTPLIGDTAPLPRGQSRADLLRLYGLLCVRQGCADDAQTWLRRAHRAARESGHRPDQLRTLLARARTAAAHDATAEAEAHLEAASAYDDLDQLPLLARRFAADGTVAQAANRPEDALWAYRQALSAATTAPDRPRAASLQLALAQLETVDRAQAFAAAAVDTFESIGAPDQAEVARAFLDEEPTSAAAPPPLYPSVETAAELSALLDQVAPSMPLIADACLQAVVTSADRWAGVYRVSDDGSASVVCEQGSRPDGVHPPSPGAASADDSARWIRLRTAPTFLLGLERGDGTPEVASRVESWAPVMGWALGRALSVREASGQGASPSELAGVVSESRAMQAIVDRLRRAQPSHSPILLTGEGGVGKRRLAQALHDSGERADGPLVRVPAADLQRHPTEERLFGVVDEDGTLTPGAVHEADGGTLVIEDVDALSLSAQSSLLQLLRTGRVAPENATDHTAVDVRIVATTTADLEERLRNGHVRPALRDALRTISVEVPPLRERRADIPLLVRHFLDTLRPDGAALATVTEPAMEALRRYDWPGNVRQLRNEIERVLVHVSSEPTPTVDTDTLLDDIVAGAQSQDPTPAADGPDAVLHPNQTLSDVLARTEKDVIERVLRACDGQVTASADVLGLSRQGLYKKMKRLGIDASAFQPSADEAPVSS